VKRLLVMLAVLVSAAYVGCKQTEGDRCQVNDDCESGVCNQANGTCDTTTETGDIDASVPDGQPLPPPDTLPPADPP
jgi:hypothetical protein